MLPPFRTGPWQLHVRSLFDGHGVASPLASDPPHGAASPLVSGPSSLAFQIPFVDLFLLQPAWTSLHTSYTLHLGAELDKGEKLRSLTDQLSVGFAAVKAH